MNLSTIKNKIICEEICSIFKGQFSSSFNLESAELLLNDNFIIFHYHDSYGLLYCAICTINDLHLGKKSLNFSYSYVREDKRNNGFGTKFFKQRLNYFAEEVYPITVTIRLNNIPSLKIVMNEGFIPVSNFKYKNGDDGLKLILIR